MPYIENSFIDEITDRVDIVEYIGRYVKLKVIGKKASGLCPFHGEKTPSFHVNGERGVYHCFGCGVKGGLIKFVQDYHQLDFPQAIKKIADDNGLTVRYTENNNYDFNKAKQAKEYRELLLQRMNDQSEFFMQNLYSARGDVGVSYLKSRGFDITNQHHKDILLHYKIGYAGDSSNLTNTTDPQLIQQFLDVDLLRLNEQGKRYESFRERIIFPIINSKGETVGFSGRTVKNHQAKYLNSKDTKLYNKSQVLYGLWQTITFYRSLRQQLKELLLVEGNLDVVSLAKNGIYNAVASSGTSLSETQLNEIFKFSDSLVCCFDADAAGQKAALNVAKLSFTLGRHDRFVSFMFLEQGEDPDSFINKYGVEAFMQQRRNSISAIDFISEFYVIKAKEQTDIVNNQIQFYNSSFIELICELDPDNYFVASLKNKMSQVSQINLELLDQQITILRNKKSSYAMTKPVIDDQYSNTKNSSSPPNKDYASSSSRTRYNRQFINSRQIVNQLTVETETANQGQQSRAINNKINLLDSYFKSMIMRNDMHNLLFNHLLYLISQADNLINKSLYQETIDFLRQKIISEHNLNPNLDISKQIDLEKLDFYAYIKENREFSSLLEDVLDNSAIMVIQTNIKDNLLSFITGAQGALLQLINKPAHNQLEAAKMKMIAKKLRPLIDELNGEKSKFKHKHK